MLTVYDKILWMELIGLDNRQSDMGIKAYVDNLGFVPDAVSIFMWSPDFVHFHDGLDADALRQAAAIYLSRENYIQVVLYPEGGRL